MILVLRQSPQRFPDQQRRDAKPARVVVFPRKQNPKDSNDPDDKPPAAMRLLAA
jgi:hypothetical protein